MLFAQSCCFFAWFQIFRRKHAWFDQLKVEHASFPRPRLIANPLFYARYIEQLGAGTADICRRCREAGLTEPSFRHENTEIVRTFERLEWSLGPTELSKRQREVIGYVGPQKIRSVQPDNPGQVSPLHFLNDGDTENGCVLPCPSGKRA